MRSISFPYFYGENIGDKEIQDLVAMLRKGPKADRLSVLHITVMLLKMQRMADDAKKYPPNRKVPDEMLNEFYSVFVPFATAINEMSKK